MGSITSLFSRFDCIKKKRHNTLLHVKNIVKNIEIDQNLPPQYSANPSTSLLCLYVNLGLTVVCRTLHNTLYYYYCSSHNSKPTYQKDFNSRVEGRVFWGLKSLLPLFSPSSYQGLEYKYVCVHIKRYHFVGLELRPRCQTR